MTNKYYISIEDNDGYTRVFTLLGCPFCGGEPAITFIGNNHTKSRKVKIWCDNCNAEMTMGVIKFGIQWLINKIMNCWNNRS